MNKLPATIDPVALTRQQTNFKGSLDLESMSRLTNLLVNPTGEAQVEINFNQDESGRMFIQLRVLAQLELVCQRCGEPVSCDINVEPKISPVLTDKQASSVPKQYDPWVTDGQPISTVELVEEELLLSLPMVAKHEQCPVEISRVFS